ncbi:uncharacterized protein Dana_GF20714 [Drosophila ananassae]|uniref:Uncharacterized protein n=1 Tax=Drosophila ananassae TaxID=7217 RepID=B3N1Q3_DROAN|nr:uncharacterized protein LOC6503407 [Drosophila ananassae]EDV34022.2 uncharacterized protein Dana_GF20714 [Drosophila ananassae]
MVHLSAAALLMLQLVVPPILATHPHQTPPVTQPVDNFDGLVGLTEAHIDNGSDMHFDSSNPTSDPDSDSNPGNATRILRRGKRYLQFAKGSRMSWRTNGKNNLWTINALYAYGYGFRANYPFPSIEEQKKDNAVFFRLFKRDLFSKLETALDGHGFDGRACMLKSFCTVVHDVDNPRKKSGMLFKLLKLIFSLDEHDKRHMPHLREENCEQIMHSHCPLSFDSISPYTDDI